MKIPEKAPSWIQLLRKIPRQTQGRLYLSLQDLIKQANKDYLYWDDFKYLKMPDNTTAEQAWVALKIVRVGQQKSLKFEDKEGVSFNYIVPDSALKILHFIDQHAAGEILVNEPGIREDEKSRYVIHSLVEEAITSSQIEGAATTRAVAKEMLRTGRKPKDYAEKMIYNNYTTITSIKNFIEKPLTPDLLMEFHKCITKDTLDKPEQEGHFRTEAVEVYDEDGQTVLHSPPPVEKIETSIQLLCQFANTEEDDDSADFIHPVVKAIILHFWMAYLHPFIDGNGRTARALFYWYVLKKKYWLFEFLSISQIILRKRIQYYKSFLYSEIDDGDMTYFLMFHLRAIKESIDELRKYLQRKQRESIQTRKLLVNFPELNDRQRNLLANALERPGEQYTFEKHANIHGIVYQTARTDLFMLRDFGFLEMQKIGKKFYFYPAKDLKEKIIEKR